MPAAPRFSPRIIGIGAAIVTVAVWSAFIVIARASAARSLTPLDLTFVRICGAALVLIPWGAWLVLQERRVRPSAGSLFGLSPLPLRITALAGVFGGLVYAVLAYSGFFFAPAAHASVLMPGSLPLWTALLAAWVLRDRITPARALGLALIVAGDLMVGGRSLLQAWPDAGPPLGGPAPSGGSEHTTVTNVGALLGGEVWKGDLLFMSAAFCWACYSVVARRHGLDAVRATIAITVFAFVTYVPAYALLAAGGWVASRIGSAPWGELVFQMLFQGVGSVVISGISFTRMIQHFGPVRSTMITALVPGLSALGAVAFLGEPLHWNLIAGLLLVTAGILFGVQRVAMKKIAAHAGTTGAAGRFDA